MGAARRIAFFRSPQKSNPTSVSGRAQHSRAGAGHSNMDPLQAKREPKGHAGD